MISVGSRVLIFPFLFYLYHKSYFEKAKPVIKREVPLLIGCLCFFQVSDYLANELMWSNNERIIRKYKQYSDV